jgi:hypothetical protein
MLLINSKCLAACRHCQPARLLSRRWSGKSPRDDVLRVPKPHPGAPATDRNSGMVLNYRPAPRHHGAAPPLPVQGT